MANDVAWSSVFDFVTLAVRLLSFLMLGRQLGPDAYGAYLGLYGIIIPIGGLCYTGLQLAVLQRGIRDGIVLDQIVPRYTTLVVVQGCVGTCVAVALAAVLIHDVSTTTAFAFAFTELLCIAVIQVTASFVHVARSFRSATRIRVTVEIVRTLTLVPLFATHSLSLERLAWLMVVAMLLLCAAVVGIVLRRVGIRARFGRPQRADVVVGAHLAMSLFSQSVKTDGDKAVLNGYGLAHQAGVYGAGYRVVQMALVPTTSLQTAFFHRVLRVDDADSGTDIHRRRAVRFTALMAVVSVALVAGVLLASPLFRVLLGSTFDESSTVVWWLIALIPVIALGKPPSNGLAALNRLALRTAIAGSAAAVSMVLYFALIPPFGWRGAAVGSIIGEVGLSLALWIAFLQCDRASRRTAVEPSRVPTAAFAFAAQRSG